MYGSADGGREPDSGFSRPAPMPSNHPHPGYPARMGVPLAAAILIVACSGGGPDPSPSASVVPSVRPGASPGTATPGTTPPATPEPTPGSSPEGTPIAVGKVEHPTDPTAIVLRINEIGGFVPPTFTAVMAPRFTLYGDNTVIFRPTTDPNGSAYPPFVKAIMNADQVDALLSYSLTRGHLANARESYENMMVADAPTTVFTIDAGGIKKQVSVYGLGIDTGQRNPDAADFAAFEQLAGVLNDFDAQVKKGQVESVAVYQPTMYRAILSEFAPAGPANEWPWPDLTLDDFSASEATGLLTGVITADQASKVTKVPSGGVMDLAVEAPQKKVFGLLLRPLLPDEAA